MITLWHALVIGDMPFMSYHTGIETAVANAGRFIKEGGVSAVRHVPRFVKQNALLLDQARAGVLDYVEEVQSGRFPGKEHCY
jgi:ketopantoate hydroxymethyltransferase